MAADNLTNLDEPESAVETGGAEFVLSSHPVVSREGSAPLSSARDYDNLGELPRSYGGSFLFALARDPHAVFVYWDVDWPAVFGDNPPPDHKVQLRVLWHEGIEESSVAVEPMAGSHLLSVLHSRSSYRIELGYYAPEKIWNSVAISSAVITPPDDVSEGEPVDVATIPFHLSFQRIVDTFRGSKYDGDALAEIISQVQRHADTSDAALPEEERELLRALESSQPEADAEQRARLRNAPDLFPTREKVESLLGFGATSPI